MTYMRDSSLRHATLTTVALGLLLLMFSKVPPCSGSTVRIKNAQGFIDIAKNVDKGKDYSGTTILLDSDLDFSGGLSTMFTTIGNVDKTPFQGVFDGQGYALRNFVINYSSQHVGLFGYSTTAVIRNLVLDSSCSITSSYTGPGTIYVSGVITYCETENGHCIIENIVNMANVSFTGNNSVFSGFLGGIAGTLKSFIFSTNTVLVKNCANYGQLTYSGITQTIYIGGIVCQYIGEYNGVAYIKNCFNYGTIVHTSNCDMRNIGGIVGISESTTYENCMNVGKIYVSNKCVRSDHISPITGHAYFYTTISHCFWTYDNFTETCYSVDDRCTLEGSYMINTLNITTVNELNDYANKYDLNRWIFNENRNSVSFNINMGDPFVLTSELILLPDLAESEGYTFSGWFTDRACITPFEEVVVLEDKSIYGGWNYTVSFESNGGSTEPDKSIVYGQYYGTLPSPTKENLGFIWWYTENNEKIFDDTRVTIQKNHVLYALWSNTTVTFDSKGGTPETEKKGIAYGEAYGKLPQPERTGYIFEGWYTESNVLILENSIVEINGDHTLYANWILINYTMTFDFANGTKVDEAFGYNVYVVYPSVSERDGYTFNEWSRIVIKMPPEDCKVTVVWTINRYNVTFDFGNGNKQTTELPYNESIVYPKAPTKSGYKFKEWNASIERVPSHDVVIEAIYEKDSSKYNVTFDFGNGTKHTISLGYDEKIDYPEDPVNNGYKFKGWDTDIERMPDHDIVLTAEWEKIASQSGAIVPEGSSRAETEPSKGPTIIIIIIIIIVVLIILLAAVFLVVSLLLFIKMRREKEENQKTEGICLNKIGNESDDNKRIVSERPEESVPRRCSFEATTAQLPNIYPADYTKPCMRDALIKAGDTEAQADEVCSTCQNSAQIAKKKGRISGDLTEEDAAAIAMYTFDFGADSYEDNPYRIINKSLIENDHGELQKVSGILYLVMTALRKLPRVTGITLYRGVRSEVNLDETHYSEGNEVVWSALSSTSPDMKTVKTFLAKGSKTGKATGTLFIIENGWGYNIQPYSLFPEETEILLEPGRRFIVRSVIEAEGIVIITLEMLDTPLILPEVFGEGKK